MAASVLFAAGTVVNVAVGRLTFALGLAVALAALAARPRRTPLARRASSSLATAPASPVAGVMLGLALTAWWLHTRRPAPAGARRPRRRAGARPPRCCSRRAASSRSASGRWPGRSPWPRSSRSTTGAHVVRLGAALYAIACAATFIVPNPLGANATRLGMFVAAPVLVLTARRLRSPLVAVALAGHGLVAVVAGVRRHRPRRTRPLRRWPSYHQPLIDAVRSAGPPNGRVEIVPTQRHWETVHVAAELPLARGWERQLDMGRNAIFYDTELDPDAYHRWLRDHAVRFVALADVPIDPSGTQEADLVRRGLPFLEPVWHDDHWRLWRVADAEPLVDGPARLVRLDPTAVVLDVAEAEPVLVRVRYSTPLVARPGRVRRRRARTAGPSCSWSSPASSRSARSWRGASRSSGRWTAARRDRAEAVGIPLDSRAMPIPKSVAAFNRRVTNRLTRPFAGRLPGFAVVSHAGRRSGRVYRTPVNVFHDGEVYVFALTYGGDSDWVKNVEAAGGCEIDIRGRVVRLVDPRRFTDPTRECVPAAVRAILRLIDVDEFLSMHVARE